MLRILVCIKQVYDLEQVLPDEWKITADGQQVLLEYAAKIMNPYDAGALELALRLKERCEKGQAALTVLTIGSVQAEKILKSAYALGADSCVRIEALPEAVYRPSLIAGAIAQAVTQLGGFDLLFFGASAGEYDNGQTGILVSEWLNCPCICETEAVSWDGERLEVQYAGDQGRITGTARPPVAVTVASPPDVFLRSPTLKAVLAASKKPVQQLAFPADDQVPSPKKQEQLELVKREGHCIYWDAADMGAIAQALQEALAEKGGGT